MYIRHSPTFSSQNGPPMCPLCFHHCISETEIYQSLSVLYYSSSSRIEFLIARPSMFPAHRAPYKSHPGEILTSLIAWLHASPAHSNSSSLSHRSGHSDSLGNIIDPASGRWLDRFGFYNLVLLTSNMSAIHLHGITRQIGSGYFKELFFFLKLFSYFDQQLMS